MKNFRSRRNRRSSTLPEITLTPLIDTALTLLVIFMITTPMLNNVIKINLPSSSVNEHNSKEEQETVVYIDKDGKLYLNCDEMDLQTIMKKLQILGHQKKVDMVFVKADQAVEYGRVIDIVDTVKTAGGIKCVALATQRAVH